MKISYILSISFLISFQAFTFGQSFNTISSGDIENAQTWENGMLPPFIVDGNNLEIPSHVELNIYHELSTTKSEVINKGIVHISYDEYDNPTIHWRNFGNMDFTGWSPDLGSFINEQSGKVLFLHNFSFCQHTGCGSENFGTMYVNTCLSNICAYDSASRFINHKGAEIIICEDGYIENYWRLPSAGSIENLVFINNGIIRSDEDSPSQGFINSGNDFFNNNPNSMGTFTGNDLVTEPQIDCISELPDIKTVMTSQTSIQEVKIFPNPSTGMLFIDSSLKFDNLNIINSLGQIEKSVSFQDAQNGLNLDLKTGVFIIQLIKDSTVLVNKKIVFIEQ